MSLRAVGIVSTWENVSTTEIAIGFHVANCENGETGECFPSLDYIARKCSIDRSTVRRNIAKMERKGLIKRVFSYNSDGKQQTTRYLFGEGTSAPPGEGTHAPPEGGTHAPPQGGTHASHNQEEGTRKKEPGKKQTKKPTANDYSPEFEEVWAWYPRRAGGNPKGKGAKAYAQQRKEHSHDDLLRKVQEYARYIEGTDRVQTEFVKQTASFFGRDFDIEENWELPRNETSTRTPEKTRDQIHRETYEKYARGELSLGDI